MFSFLFNLMRERAAAEAASMELNNPHLRPQRETREQREFERGFGFAATERLLKDRTLDGILDTVDQWSGDAFDRGAVDAIRRMGRLGL